MAFSASAFEGALFEKHLILGCDAYLPPRARIAPPNRDVLFSGVCVAAPVVLATLMTLYFASSEMRDESQLCMRCGAGDCAGFSKPGFPLKRDERW